MRCKNCKVKFTPRYFNIKYCEKDECYSAMISVVRAKQNKARVKEEKKATNVMKENLKTKSDYKKILQVLINQIIRLIDKDCPCIATNKFEGKMNAGHYISVGANDTIRFHLDNIHIQSEHSNSYRGGDTIRYQLGLKRVYGVEYFEYVETLQNTPPIRLSIDDLKQKISLARSIVKELKDLNCIYDTETRIKLRAYYNEELGIYK